MSGTYSSSRKSDYCYLLLLLLLSLALPAWGATTNVANGGLYHSQELLATRGTPLALDMSLFYNSMDSYQGSLSQGWTHSYDIILTDGSNGSKVLHDGDTVRLYLANGTGFTSQTGDTSVLTPNGTGFLVTYRDGLKQYFGADGKIISTVDRYGNTASFTYTNGDLTTITDPSGRSITLEYDTAATPRRLKYLCPPGVTTTDPPTRKYNFEYDPTTGMLSKVTNPLADASATARGFWQYTYENGRVKTIIDPNGKLFTFSYYPDGRVKSSVDPEGMPDADGVATVAGHTRTLVYNGEEGAIKTTTFIEKDGGVWTYVYDSQAGVLKQKIAPNPDGTPGGTMTAYVYYADGSLKAKTEPSGAGKRLTTFYRYDGFGNLTNETEPLDLSLSQYSGIDPETVDTTTFGTGTSPVTWAFAYEYDNNNFDRPIKITDKRGSVELVTRYAHTTENGLEVTRITDPENLTTTVRRYPDGNLHSISDPKTNTTVYEYYQNTSENLAAGIAGLLKSVKATDNIRTNYTAYDKSGNVHEIQELDKNGVLKRTTNLEYDALSRLRKVIKTTTDDPPIVTETKYDYDASGNLTVTDPELKQTQYHYNYSNQVVKIIDHDQKETRFSYGGSGCASCGGSTDKLTEVLDARQIAMVWPGTTYQYDKQGRLERETDPRGKAVRYTYYDNGLVKEKIDATAVPEKILITYEYNNQGQLTKKQQASGFADSYEYDANGRLWKASNPHISYTLEWYKNGRLKSVTDNSGKRVSYVYDGAGNRTQMTGPDGITYYTSYDRSNRPYWLYTPAGLFDLGYDGLGRLDKISWGWSGNPGITYAYDGLDRITSIKRTDYLGQILANIGYGYDLSGNRLSRSEPGTNTTYEYDNLYRLKTVTTNGVIAESYDYDEVGNRKTGPSAATSYAYSQGNQLDSRTGATYEYDDYGNLKKRIQGTTTFTYLYDDENRLKTVEKKSGTVLAATVNLVYDPFGRRIERRVLKGSTETVNRYVYDGENILYEYDGANQLVRRIANHPGAIDFPIAYNTATAAYFYFRNGLGSVNFVTDQNGTAVAEYSYDSFGVPIKTRLGSQPQPFSYTGREYDTDTQLYYYRARYYDPSVGRFISKDPSGIAGGINLYSYVQNNPINFIDPYGLASTPVTDILNGLEFGFRAAGVVVWEGKKAAAQEAAKAVATEYLSKLLRLSEPSSFLVDKAYTGSQIPSEASSMKEMAERISDRINRIRNDVYKNKCN